MPVGKAALHALERKEVVTTEHGWRGSMLDDDGLCQGALLAKDTLLVIMSANNAASKVSCELKLTLPQEDPPALQEGTPPKSALQAFMAEVQNL